MLSQAHLALVISGSVQSSSNKCLSPSIGTGWQGAGGLLQRSWALPWGRSGACSCCFEAHGDRLMLPLRSG